MLVGDLGTIVSALSVTGISGVATTSFPAAWGGCRLRRRRGRRDLWRHAAHQWSGAIAGADGADFIDGGEGNDTILADDGSADEGETPLGIVLGGVVWADADPRDHLRAEAEDGIPNLTVHLFKSPTS